MGKTGRWGFGLLDVNRRDEAAPSEGMANAVLGLFATKLPDGTPGQDRDVISYAYASRVTQAYRHFNEILVANNHTGGIYKVDLGNAVGPLVMQHGEAVTGKNLVIASKKLSYIRFFLDVDIYDRESGNPVPGIEPTLSLQFTTERDGEDTRSTTINSSLSSLNERIFTPHYELGDVSAKDFTIDALTLYLPDGASHDVVIALHSLFVAFEEVE